MVQNSSGLPLGQSAGKIGEFSPFWILDGWMDVGLRGENLCCILDGQRNADSKQVKVSPLHLRFFDVWPTDGILTNNELR